MTPPEIAQMIEVGKAVGACIAAIGGVVAAVVGLLNHAKIHEVHVLVNSRLSELIEATLSKGRILERADIASGAISSPNTPASRVAAELVVHTAAATAEALVSAAAPTAPKT
jgi:hypothetical protein